MFFYSPSTSGFYSSVVHKAAIPTDAISISSDQHKTLLEGLSNGQQIVVEAGMIGLKTCELDLSAIERAWRDGELERLVWLRERHRDQLEITTSTALTSEQFNELLVYIQALRDWPQSNVFPEPSARPSMPSWITDHRL